MLHGRVTRFTFYRLMFLMVSNLLLLAVIRLLLQEGASFADVLRGVASNTAPTMLAGLGLTAIIFTGAIDLSIGAIIVVAGAVFGVMVHHGMPPALCYAACVATAWSLSMCNGYLVRALHIPALIITLGGLTLYRGVGLIIADVGVENFIGNISVHSDAYHGPGKFYAGWILLATVAAMLFWVSVSRTPRRWLALGNSEEACRLQGLNTGRIMQSAFGVGGLLLGIAALIEVTRVQAIEPARMATGFELEVIGAVVLGGTNIFGGEGSFAGTVLGVVFLYLTEQVLTYAGVSVYFRDVIIGGTIVAVIGIDCLLHRRRKLLEELK